ncbi:MAG TPA: S41 family peptidase [Polyangiaceae bacterium]|nr:S41 family peptidase [Polyangiaceae bacterium]
MRPLALPLLSMFVALASAAGCQSAGVNPSAAGSSRRTPESTQAQPQALPTGDPVGQKFEDWAAAINSGDRARIDGVWRGAKDAELRASTDMGVAERTGGFELHRVEDATATEMLAVVRARRNERWLCILFNVDSDPPHAIQTILLRPTGAPPDPANTGASVAPFDDKTRGQIVQALVRELNRAYVFPEKALAIERELNARQRQHAYDALASRLLFARTLTDDLQRMTHDKHLHVEVACSRGAARPGREPRTSPVDAGADRPRVFGQARRLDGNVAYIDIATFGVPGEQARDDIRDTMSAAADAAAIILDVRRNGGGEPETVALVSSYLFGSAPVHLNSLYWRVPDRTDDFFTDPRVQGAKFGPKKPVYVLTSARTFSAAEEFTYNLQALKRAVIVGETTGGGAHPGDLVPLPHGFTVFVPSGRAINPITNTNWEGTGVKPDVTVPAETALETAHQLALAQVRTDASETRRDGEAGP